MRKTFSCCVAGQYYEDIQLSLSYDKKNDEWGVEVLNAGDYPEGVVPAIEMEALFNGIIDFHELQMEWEYDQEERMACDRYHSDRDEW